MRDGACAFFQIRGIFHYFRAFKTEIFHIYSLTGQILKQLFPSVSVPSENHSPRRFAAWWNIFHYSPPLRGIIANFSILKYG